MNPHDLIAIDASISERWSGTPQWVHASLARAPFVVVRRACVTDCIPVGVRGTTRAQRHAAHITHADVRRVISPESLVCAVGPQRGRPIDDASSAVADAAQRYALRWGPTGGYGFELASGVPTVHAASDLDIMIHGSDAEGAQLSAFAQACANIEARTGVRIDIEVAFAHGAIALAELLSGKPVVLAKMSAGPALVACPI
jgi:phosphoribosyl-dephospho-CoA transferase